MGVCFGCGAAFWTRISNPSSAASDYNESVHSHALTAATADAPQ